MQNLTRRLFLFLAMPLVFSVSPAELVAETAALPVFEFENHEPVPASLLNTSSVEHRVDFTLGKIKVISTWHVANIADANGRILIGFDAEPEHASVVSVRLGGKPVQFQALASNKRYYEVAVPGLAKGQSDTVVIETSIADPESESALHALSVYNLPKIARLVNRQGKHGWDLRALSRHSYGDVVPTTFVVRHPTQWLAIGSSKVRTDSNIKGQVEREFEPLASGRYTLLFASAKHWKAETFKVSERQFTLLSRNRDALLSKDFMQSLAEQILPRFASRFRLPSDHIVLVDSDWAAVSGGLLGNNILGFFGKQILSKDDEEEIRVVFGREPASSTRASVEKIYAGAKDPWREYMTGMFAHELAHLYFGFGRTTERITDLHHLWLSLGLGLVYDEVVTKEITGRQDTFFAAVENHWRTKFASNSQVDQRLVNPDTTKDKVFGLSRAHVYAHGKALVVLRSLRSRLGNDRFDGVVAKYLDANCPQSGTCLKGGEFGGYEMFRSMVASIDPELPAFEAREGVK